MTRFSKKEAIKFGFTISKKNILFFLGIIAIYGFITFLTSSISNSLNDNRQALFKIIFNLLMVVVSSVMSMGIISISLKFAGQEKPNFKDLFYIKSLLNYIFASVLKGLIIFFGFILLIIPGIIFAIKLQFVSYLIVDKKIGAIEAIKKSWKMTKGVKWNLFLLGLLLGLINVLGFLCLMIGLVITVPLAWVAQAYVYRKLLK